MSEASSDVLSLLQQRYRSLQGKWVCAAEVGNGTGARRTRVCDYMALGCWPSDGIHLHGHEVKVWRNDWLREMQDVSKSQAFVRHCHYWWLVAPKGIIKLQEIPATWGLLQATKGGLRVAKPATYNRDAELSWSFVAAFLRAATSQSDAHKQSILEFDRGFAAGAKNAEQNIEAVVASKVKFVMRQFEELKSMVAEFEAHSGVKLRTWNGTNCGRAFEFAQTLRNPKLMLGDIKLAHNAVLELLSALTTLNDRIEGQQ